MFRRVVGPIACSLLFAWGVFASPRKDDPSAGYYLASMVGDKVVIEVDDGDQRWENVFEVTAARQQGAVVLVTYRHHGTGEGEQCRCEVSDSGVYKHGDGARWCHLRLPFRKGETWEHTGKDKYGDTFTIRFTSTQEEEIEVPAGKFQCLRVESNSVVQGVTWKSTTWMAPRIGTVKHVLVGKDGERTDYMQTSVLKSFTAGGK